jgi:flagellar hook-associated protein 2
MSFSVSGLASGLDTASLVNELMFAERSTVRRLEASKSDEQRAADAWSDIGSRLSEVASAISAIRTGDALIAATAGSSDEAVARVTAGSGALTGTYSFSVDSLAAANQMASAGLSGASALTGAGTATVTGGFTGIGATLDSHTLADGVYQLDVTSVDTDAGTATIVFDGTEQTVDNTTGSITLTGAGGTVTVSGTLETGSASLVVVETDASTTVAGLAASLNAAGSPVRAQLIDTGDGTATPTRLVISSTTTGIDGAADVDLSGLSLFAGGLTTLRAASDAVLTVGGAGGLTITRSQNTVSDVFDGLTLDLIGTSAGTDVEITVSADIDSRLEAVAGVVDSVSNTLRKIYEHSTYDVDAGTGGVLVGDFSSRQVAADVQRAMGTVVDSGPFVLFSQIGVTFERDGTYSIDEVELRQALTDDPDGVADVLLGDPGDDGDGVLDVLAATVDGLDDPTGRVTTAQEAREANIDELDRLIALQEVRLENVEARYLRQFAGLESLISQLQGQASYLTSVIGGLS